MKVKETSRLLLVEDSPGDAELVRMMLDESPTVRFDLVYAGLLRDALQLLAAERFDAVLLDLNLPDGAGIRTLVRVFEAAPGLPVVILTGNQDEVLAVEAVQRGAQDYLVKGEVEPRLLVRTLRYAIERKRLTVELEQKAEELRRSLDRLNEMDLLKDGFLATVSHELRTPLTSIKGFAQTLLDGAEASRPEVRREDLLRILRNAERLERLVNRILDLARLESGRAEVRREVLDLPALAESVASNWAPAVGEKRLEVRVEAAANLPRVSGDPDQIVQVLDNLFSNAVKFTEPGGRILLRIAPDLPAREIRVSLRDTGIGVGAGDRTRIFQKFTQADQTDRRRYGGTGLGLTISREILRLHGGRIWVESEPGNGSEFIFTLPLVDAPAP